MLFWTLIVSVCGSYRRFNYWSSIFTSCGSSFLTMDGSCSLICSCMLMSASSTIWPSDWTSLKDVVTSSRSYSSVATELFRFYKKRTVFISPFLSTRCVLFFFPERSAEPNFLTIDRKHIYKGRITYSVCLLYHYFALWEPPSSSSLSLIFISVSLPFRES